MENEIRTKSQIITGAICGTIMILAIIAYLIIGIVANLWHPYWLIIVCSALICGIVGLISDTTAKLKALKREETKKDNMDN